MSPEEKLAAILAAVQVDPGRRGLANLFGVFPQDFAEACRSLAGHSAAMAEVVTGFFIASSEPPAFETDGPLGAVFRGRALAPLLKHIGCLGESEYAESLRAGLRAAGFKPEEIEKRVVDPRTWWPGGTHLIA